MSVPEPDLEHGLYSLSIYPTHSEAYRAYRQMPLSQVEQGTMVAAYGGGYAVVNPRGFPISLDEMLRHEFAAFASHFGEHSSESWVQAQWVKGRKRDGKPVPEGW